MVSGDCGGLGKYSEHTRKPMMNTMDTTADHGNARSWWSRAWNGLRAEFEPLHPRLLLVDLLVRPLPQLAFQRLRTTLYRGAGIAIGPRALIAGRLDLIGPGPIASRLSIGADCWLNAPIFADLSGPIRIGNHVTIGHHVIFITANHALWPAPHRAGPVEPAPVVIGDGAWLGAGVTLLPGSSVGAGAVIGAGSLVTGEVPPGVIAVGRPARVLRRITASELASPQPPARQLCVKPEQASKVAL